MLNAKFTVDYSGIQKKVDADHYFKYCNSILKDVSANWQRTRYGVSSSFNPSVNGLTMLSKGKDSPMLDSGQLRMSQRVEEDGKGKFIIGTDKKYGAMLMTGGKWTSKKGPFVIPCTPEVKRMQKRLYFVKAIIAELRQKYNYAKNKSSVFSNKKGVFLVKKIGKTGTNWTRLLLFRRTITMPKRNLLFFTDPDKNYINNAIKAYFDKP